MVIDVVVEIPRGSQNKYEVDHETGRIRLDRVLFSPFHYPTEYGFVENTLGEDGDPIDVMVLMSQPTFPGCIVRSRLVGVLEMSDENGVDNKILAVAVDDPRMNGIETIHDVSQHTLKEIAHFFATYKELEGKESLVGGWQDHESAERILKESQERFAKGQH
ncbi:MAG: inorganic diphosphatase [Sulfobacillus thermotolerans]|nr:inorganic diphosphatase [Sulfobacillus thermotolerans]